MLLYPGPYWPFTQLPQTLDVNGASSHLFVYFKLFISGYSISRVFARFVLTVVSSSCNTWSYSDIATQKMIAVTSSKQCIHFLRSLLWPPTSNNLKEERKLKPRSTSRLTISWFSISSRRSWIFSTAANSAQVKILSSAFTRWRTCSLFTSSRRRKRSTL